MTEPIDTGRVPDEELSEGLRRGRQVRDSIAAKTQQLHELRRRQDRAASLAAPLTDYIDD